MLFNAVPSVSRQLAMRYCLVVLPFLELMGTQSFAEQEHQDEQHFLFYHANQVPSRMNGGAVQPHWMADDEGFWFVEQSPEGPVIWRVDPIANVKERLFKDTKRLRVQLSQLGLKLPENGLPIRDLHFVNGRENEVYFSVEGRAFILDLDSYHLNEGKPEVSC